MDCVIIYCTGCKKPMITLKGSHAQLEDVEYNVTEQWCKECSANEIEIRGKTLTHFSWAFKRFMDSGDCWEDAFRKAIDEVLGYGLSEKKAHEFSKKAHEGQKYGDGDYFDSHILKVVSLVKMITDDPEMVTVAYLHDTIEDTDVTYEDLRKHFTPQIADWVMELTKDGKNRFPRLKTKGCIIIKFADRLSNISDMRVWDKERQQKYLDKSVFWESD